MVARRFPTYLLLVLLAVGVFAGQPEPAPVLTVGIATGYPPYQYVGPGGQASGIDAELTRLVFRTMSQAFAFRQDNWDRLYLGLAHRRPGIDLLCGAEINPERQRLFDFSRPCYQRINVVFVRAESPFRDLADLAGLTITGDRSSFVEQNSDLDRIRVTNTATKEESFRLLATGKVAAVIAPLEVGNWFSRQLVLPMRVVFNRDPGTPVGFAVAKGNLALVRQIDQAMLILVKNGRLASLLSRYGISP